MKRLVCFADAGHRVGLGHVMRAKAVLVAVRKRGLDAELFTPLGPDQLKAQGLDQVLSVPNDAEEICRTLIKKHADLIVIDSYRYLGEIRKAINSIEKPGIVLFDDHYCPVMKAEILINGSPKAKDGCYRSELAKRFLLGPQYAAIGSFFRQVREQFSVQEKVDKILVALGGSDVGARMEKLINILDGLLPKEIEIVVAGGPCDHNKLDRIHYVGWLNQEAFARMMSEADFAFLAGGSMLLQAACLGLPVAAWPLNDNQKQHAAVWEKQGTAIVFDSLEEIPGIMDRCLGLDNRFRMYERGRNLVDGLGADRIAEAVLQVGLNG